jgi:hypothetical protein
LGHDLGNLLGFILHGQERSLLHVLVVSKVSVDKVGGKSFDGVVEFVLQDVVGNTSHEEVGPEGVISMDSLVVLNQLQAVLQVLGVQKWVKGVLACAEHAVATAGSRDAAELFFSEVL